MLMIKKYFYLFLILSPLFFKGCSTSEATGETKLNFISESREIEMGKEADQAIVQSLGVVKDQKIQDYVSRLGMEMAKRSERPNLPWTFRVIDDPTVNAFALPGGFVYITRGILSHLDSEAELQGILGHEIGHITAKHSVFRISQQQFLQLGWGVATIFAPTLGNFNQLASIGLGLLSLKFSREDERESDMLAVRYMGYVNENPQQLIDVMQTLERVSKAQSSERLPQWLSTHPDPQNRISLIQGHINDMPNAPLNAPINKEEYYSQIEGMVFGDNPRNGFFRGSLFLHPDLKFKFQFPNGWKTLNQNAAVFGVSPNEDALIQISLAQTNNVTTAANQFLNQQGIQSSGAQSISINGKTAYYSTFLANTEQGVLAGSAYFISHGSNVYQILGYSSQNGWGGYQSIIDNSVRTFDDVSDPAVLNVKPQTIKIVTLNESMTLQQAGQRYSHKSDIQTLALINQAQANTAFNSGDKIKIVVGEKVN